MDASQLFRAGAARFNRHLMLPVLRHGGPVARVLGRSTAVITYTGRKSGRSFTFPVSYKREGDTVRIAVAVPSAKTWWRNFVGDGAPMRLRLAGVDHDAHAVAVRRDDGAVRVTATLSS